MFGCVKECIYFSGKFITGVKAVQGGVEGVRGMYVACVGGVEAMFRNVGRCKKCAGGECRRV